MDRTQFSDWIGREEIRHDVARPGPVEALAGLLDYGHVPWAGGVLPPLAHWLYFAETTRQSALDEDGHPLRGGFLPPITLPRRMWAGSTIEFLAPLALGTPLCRRSRIEDISEKNGRSGRLIFVRLRHDIEGSAGPAVREWQDVVYREAPHSSPPPPALPELRRSDACRRVVPDSRLLFRYSALTYNAHRIHYDKDYCRQVEGYSGLVVHGPLLATLLLDHAFRLEPDLIPARFTFRAQHPLFDTAAFELCRACGPEAMELWVRGPDGVTAMRAQLRTL